MELNKISNMIYQIFYIGYKISYIGYKISDILNKISDICIINSKTACQKAVLLFIL